MGEAAPVDLGIAGLGPAVRIGAGGFADVYRAQQTNLRRDVAVKVLRAQANDAQARMRFERECHAMGAVSGHPNIVAVHEGGFTLDGRAYLVMEFYPGGSLMDRLAASGPMAPDDVTEIGRKIGKALGVAHDAGVLHRDVKPANILVSAYGEPALADFGIARVEGGQQTATGVVTASFAHAAPEVLEGADPSAASDLYSLGSTLFELFTGHAPHARGGEHSMWALVKRVVTEPVPDPASMGMPEPLASVVRRATLHASSARYGRAEELVAELSGAPSSVTGAAPPTDPYGRPTESLVAEGRPRFDQGGTQDYEYDPPTAVQPRVDPSRLGQPHVSQPPVEQPRVERPPVEAGPPERFEHSGAAAGRGAAPKRRRGAALMALLGVVLVAAIGVAAYLLLTSERAPELPPIALAFLEGSSGPLEAGESYQMEVTGTDETARYRLVVDDAPTGSPVPQIPGYVPEAGRHSVAVEVTRGETVETTETVEIYAIGEIPPPGWRANLLSVSAEPDNWPSALRRFDELVDAGHEGLELLPSDWFLGIPTGFWNVFVPNVAEDRPAAARYCDRFGLAVPNECFVTFFDSDALAE